MRETSFNHLLSDYNIISYFLKNICLIITFDKLSQSSLFYAIYYLIKHSSFRKNIEKEYVKYPLEIFKTKEKNIQFENNDYIQNNFHEKYSIEINELFGQMCY